MLIDTHLHLDFHQYDDDRVQVIERALEAGVSQMITIGTSLATSQRAIELSDQFESVWATVGIHPNSASEWNDEAEVILRELAQHTKVVAIGEIGLDYYWDRVAPAVQQQAFDEQLALAADLGLPVVIHDREAHEDVMNSLRCWVKTLQADAPRGVLHFFSGDIEMAEEAIQLGFYLGTDGPVTFKKAYDLQHVVAALPLDRLLIETDAPFLAPHPRRGKRNEPAYVSYVAQKVAELKHLTLEEVAKKTTANARSLFGLGF